MEQYKLIMTMFDNEMNRYWLRYNLFLGFEIALFIGIVSSLKFLVLNSWLFCIVLAFVLAFSFGFFIIVLRGYSIQIVLQKVISEIEQNSNGKLIIFSSIKSKSRLPLYINGMISLILVFIILIFWIVFFLFIILNNYQL